MLQLKSGYLIYATDDTEFQMPKRSKIYFHHRLMKHKIYTSKVKAVTVMLCLSFY